MKAGKWTVLAIGLATLTLSGAVGAGQAGPAEPDSEPIVVPVGRIGDVVTYSAFVRNSTQDDWTPVRSWAFQVGPIAETPDQSGRMRTTVPVLHRVERLEGDFDSVASRTHWTWDNLARSYVDLATRSVDRIDAWYSTDFDSSLEAEDWAELYEDVYYGPDFWNGTSGRFWAFFNYGAFPFPFALQGRSLTAGHQLDPARTHLFDREWAPHEPGAGPLEAATKVVGYGTVGGTRAADVRTEGCLRLDVYRRTGEQGRFRDVPWAYNADGGFLAGQLPFLHAVVPMVSHVCFQVDLWLTGQSAYPAHYEESVYVDGRLAQQWSETLSGVAPGQAPIPWEPEQPHAVSVVPRERSPDSQRFPADGALSRIESPLSGAVRAVEADAGLAAFRSWRAQNPKALLVGAEYASERVDCPPSSRDYSTGALPGPDEPLKVWSLVYGSAPSSYFAVLSFHVPGTDVRINCEIGPMGGDPLDLDELVQGPVTIGAAEQAWYDFEGSSSKPPDHVAWGAVWRCVTNRFSHQGRDCPSGERIVDLKPLKLQRINVGLWDTPLPQASAWAIRGIEIDAGTGELEATGKYRDWTKLVTPDPATRPRPAEAVALAMPAEPATFPMALAATAAGGVLFAALLSYFYPILKFYGAHLLFALPGYAKLARSDVLRNPLRELILNLVRSDPGISPPEIARQTNAGWSTIVYHLHVMEKNGLISSLIDGRHKRFFPADSIDWSQRGRLSALKNAKTKFVYDLIHEEPGIFQSEIASRSGFSATAAAWHLERLQAVGLIERGRDGHKIRYAARAVVSAPPRESVEIA